MIKRKIELVKDNTRQVLLTWHKDDGEGGYIPLAIEYEDSVDQETRDRIEEICERPINWRDSGKTGKAFPGSSKHFLELPRVLGRLGYRTRLF